jgi:type VI secretion system protein ImpM
MRCGLFGKLPPKRDFVALFAPRVFLDAWEPWMRSGISASQKSLGPDWQQAFLTAPIWRFWLGAEICGTPVVGAFMPSLDGVGRYYPLTIFACADPDTPIPPPDINPQDEWFIASESLLLSALEKDVTFEAITSALGQIAQPKCQNGDQLPDDMIGARGGAIAVPAAGRSFQEICGSLRIANHASAYAAASFWWTLGGADYPPIALSCRGMADPFLFAGMLRGRFNSAIA